MEWLIRTIYSFEFSILGFTIDIGDLSRSVVNILKIDPQRINSGDLWDIAERINSAVLPIAYSLLGIFFLLDFIHITLEIDRFDWRRLIFTMIKYAIVKGVVANSMYFVLLIMNVTSDVFLNVCSAISSTSASTISVVDSLVDLVNTGNFMTDIMMTIVIIIFWVVYIAIVIAVIGQVFVRIAKMIILASLSPLAVSSMTNDTVAQAGRNFFKALIAVGLEASTIYISCIFYNLILSSMSSAQAFGNLVGIITANSIFLILIQTGVSLARELTGGA